MEEKNSLVDHILLPFAAAQVQIDARNTRDGLGDVLEFRYSELWYEVVHKVLSVSVVFPRRKARDLHNDVLDNRSICR